MDDAPRRPARFRAASITAICMPKQMPKNGTLLLAREPHRLDLARRAALAEAAGHQDAVHVLQPVHRAGCSKISLSTQSSCTFTRLAMPPCASASASDL